MNNLENRNFHHFLELDQVDCVMHLQGVYYDISRKNLCQDQRIFYRGLPQTSVNFRQSIFINSSSVFVLPLISSCTSHNFGSINSASSFAGLLLCHSDMKFSRESEKLFNFWFFRGCCINTFVSKPFFFSYCFRVNIKTNRWTILWDIIFLLHFFSN